MLSLLLAVPSCIYSFWHGVIPTSYFDFILVSLIFYPGLALTVAHGYPYVYVCTRMRTHARSTIRAIKIKWHWSKMEIAAMGLDLAF